MITSMPAKMRIETAWSESTLPSAGWKARAEEAGRAHEQNQDHHSERERVPVGRGEIGHAHHLDDADDEPAHHRAGDVAEPAEQHDREPFQADLDAEERREPGEVPGEQDAGSADAIAKVMTIASDTLMPMSPATV